MFAETDQPFVVCKNCIRAFDADYLGNKTRNTTVFSTTVNSNGDVIDKAFEAECPFCYKKEYYTEQKDVHWPIESKGYSKLADSYSLENEQLRKRLIKANAEIENLGKTNRRLKKGKASLTMKRKKRLDITQTYKKIVRHPLLRKETESLFETKHYAEAIFEAYKAVNNLVKMKSKQKLDGQELMATVFNEDRPILKLNSIRNRSEIDEQRGFRLLFMGAMTGIRNPKAHDSAEQTDPIRTLQYLAMADLLATRVDESSSSVS